MNWKYHYLKDSAHGYCHGINKEWIESELEKVYILGLEKSINKEWIESEPQEPQGNPLTRSLYQQRMNWKANSKHRALLFSGLVSTKNELKVNTIKHIVELIINMYQQRMNWKTSFSRSVISSGFSTVSTKNELKDIAYLPIWVWHDLSVSTKNELKAISQVGDALVFVCINKEWIESSWFHPYYVCFV